MRAVRLRTDVALIVAAAAVLTQVGAGSAAPGDLELFPVGTFTAPIYVTAPPGDGERLFVVEQGGRIMLVRNGGAPSLFLDIDARVLSGGEQGLFSMAFSPNYAANGLFYVFYTADPSGALTIAEYRRSSDNPDVAATAERPVLSIPHAQAGNHNGGQLQFGPDGYLYVATGDGGGGNDQFAHAQNLDSLLGKLLRIDPAGSPYAIPADNPFVNAPGRDEIWSYGLRNPWRFSFDRQTGDLTIGDVGQQAWEEVDFVPASSGRGRGANFGWGCWEGRAPGPTASRSDCTPMSGTHTPPVLQYANDASTCAVTGGYVVRDPAVPSLAGRFLYGDACSVILRSTVLQVPDAQNDQATGLTVSSVYSFGEDACGRVYVVSGAGPVYRLRVEGAPDPPCTPPVSQPPPSPPAPPPPAPPAPPPPAPPPPIDPAPLPLRPAACRVPRVIGRRLAAARIRIRRANCRPGRVRYRPSSRARGWVLTQAPRPGARRVHLTPVHVTLSSGRRRR